VEDLVQAISSQEELADKSLLVADLQKQLANSGNFLLADQYSAFVSTMQMLPG
jgi:hypothetical protein